MKKKQKRIAAVLILAALVVWVLWANTALELNTVTVSAAVPESFDGFRIAQVSDLHSAEMGQGNSKLLELLRQAQPDIIALTGDLIDCRNTDAGIALAFAAEAVKIAPCYFITGNHEVIWDKALYDTLIEGLQAVGVTVLSNEALVLEKDGESICLAGMAWGGTWALESLSDFDGYTVLLAHAPEDIPQYAAAGFDLVLSGHAHGGQFRLPFVGGLIAPGQGLFPKCDAGLYDYENTALVVSRGIGNSTIPLRFNNRPEVVLVVLECLTV